ncbi:KAT8 regulatory NSL complex subunit 1-like protein isoform X2 [Pristis pectinata]|uniref:KAT8 regulatory NSL complex subunit 1-like protein isoform X2 n=1 Tax=Pristis pectinata TaxID=685728 RepID=UPI00223E306E|nr:KAT8 regulatory NSL complex subunit 1-like protein isoform X2 [Pristis pectinata]
MRRGAEGERGTFVFFRLCCSRCGARGRGLAARVTWGNIVIVVGLVGQHCMAAMAPALTETATEGHGFQLSSSSLPSSSIEPDTFMHKDDASEEQKLNGNCDTQAAWSQLAYPCAAPGLGHDATDLKNVPYGSTIVHSSIPHNTTLLTSANSLLDRLSLNLNLSSKKLFSKDSPNIVTKNNLSCDRFKQTSGFNTGKTYAVPEAKLNSNKNGMTGLSCQKNNPLKCNSMLTDVGEMNMACVSASLSLSAPSDMTSNQKAELKPTEANSIRSSVPVDNAVHAENLLNCSRQLIQQGQEEKQLISSISVQKTERNAQLLECLDRQQKLAKKASSLRKRLQIIQAKHITHHIKQRMQQLIESEHHRQQALGKFNSSKPNLACSDGIKRDDSVQTGLDPKKPVLSELYKYTHLSKALLSRIEENVDSDATGSSTDEDSDMEETPLRRNISVKHQSEWGWAADRAKIASRWTWLQAQISELEYKIRHMNDIYRHMRSTKEMVILDDSQPSKTEAAVLLVAAENNKTPAEMIYSTLDCNLEMSPSSPSLLLRNIDKQACNRLEAPTCSILGDNEPNSSNNPGPEEILFKKKQLERTGQQLLSTNDTSARVRPLRTHNKRRLFFSVYNANRKVPAAAVHCQCSWPVCCKICDVVDPRTLTWEDRAALLDPGFHPVLSLHYDVPLSVHFQALLNEEEWDNGHVPPVMNDLKTSLANSALCKRYPHESILDSVGCNVNKDHFAKVLGQHWNQSSSIPEPHTPTEASRKPFRELRKRRHSNEKTTVVSKKHCALLNSGDSPSGSSVKITQTSGLIQRTQCSSPTDSWVSRSTPSQRALSQTKDISLRQRQQSECCYDIDNIVVPMSLVATSKIEKLQYKEIITPSWRIMAFQPVKELHMQENELEDTSDEAFALRHKKHEVREQARWLLWEQSRCHRRSNRLSSFTKNNDEHLNPHLPPSSDSEKPYSSVRCVSELAQNEETQVLLMEGEPNAKVVLPWNCRTFPLSEEEVKHLDHPEEESAVEKGGLRPLTRLYSALSENGRAASEGVPSAREAQCKLSVWGQNSATQ